MYQTTDTPMICISNPPFNIKWEIPPFAQLDNRFCVYGVPPKGNANLAFVLTGMERAEKGIFILPCSVVSNKDQTETEIRRRLVEDNMIEAAIMCPRNMFTATDIPVCLLILNKRKATTDIVLVDMSNTYTEYTREQRGQYGGKSHTNRVYEKTYNTFTDEQIEKCYNAVVGKQDIPNFSKVVTPAHLKEHNYNLNPGTYFDVVLVAEASRTYADIVADLNRVIKKRNSCKLRINETVARNIFGLDPGLFKHNEFDKEFKLPESLNLEIEKSDYITFTKNKNEVVIQNNSSEYISEVIMFAINLWRMNVMTMNNEETRLLVELQQKLTEDLLTGTLEI